MDLFEVALIEADLPVKSPFRVDDDIVVVVVVKVRLALGRTGGFGRRQLMGAQKKNHLFKHSRVHNKP